MTPPDFDSAPPAGLSAASAPSSVASSFDAEMQAPDARRYSPVSRRALLGAAAWSVPVVTLAVAAPAHAASGGTTTATITAPDPFGAAVGDSVPLVFTLTENGAPLTSGVLTVTLDDTSVVAFDPDADGYSSPTFASVVVSDGHAFPLVIVGAFGTVSGTATLGGVSISFSVEVSAG